MKEKLRHIHTNKTAQTENVLNGEVKRVEFWTGTDTFF